MIEQGKLKFGLKWGKYQVVDEMVKVAIFAYEVSSYVNVGNIVIILNILIVVTISWIFKKKKLL